MNLRLLSGAFSITVRTGEESLNFLLDLKQNHLLVDIQIIIVFYGFNHNYLNRRAYFDQKEFTLPNMCSGDASNLHKVDENGYVQNKQHDITEYRKPLVL